MFFTKLLIRSGLARYLPGVRRLGAGAEDFLPYYSNRLLASPHAELCSAAEFFEAPTEPDQIDLAAGTPNFDLVPSASTKLPADKRGYPPAWGLVELRTLVAEKFESEQQLHVNPQDEVLITHGVAGGFSVVLDTFVNRGDRVVLFDPCSPLYSLALRQRRARLRWVDGRMDQGLFRFRHHDLAHALEGARLIVLNVPANPTGANLAPEDIEEIAWWAERHDVLIFCDQAFARFQYEEQPLEIGTLVKAHRRTLTAGSVSKGHALAAARVGWLAGHRHLLRACALNSILHTPFVPTLCQQIALTALRGPEEAFATIQADFASRRRYCFERLQAMGFNAVWPAGGFFFWIPVWDQGLSGTTLAEKLRAEHKVLVWPGEHFGPSGLGYIRLSYATQEGRLREGLTRLAEFVKNLSMSAPPPAKMAA
jgi:aspartate/methionine/tyrosine aminotransferase